MSDGNGCKCAAYSESECCCEGVDWTPQVWIDDKALIESQAAQIEQLRTLCDQLGGQLTVAMAYVPIGGYGYDDGDSALSEWRQWKVTE